MCDRVASSADSQGSQPREEKAASSQLAHGKCRQSAGTQSERRRGAACRESEPGSAPWSGVSGAGRAFELGGEQVQEDWQETPASQMQGGRE